VDVAAVSPRQRLDRRSDGDDGAWRIVAITNNRRWLVGAAAIECGQRAAQLVLDVGQ
jgi:hypothetical protein